MIARPQFRASLKPKCRLRTKRETPRMNSRSPTARMIQGPQAMFREAELSEFTWLALGCGIEVLFLGSIGRGLCRGRSGGTGCGLGFAAGGWCRGCGLHHILMIACHVAGV